MPRILSRVARAAMLIGIAAGALVSAPERWSPIAPAAAQASIRADFRVALEPFGAWRHHARLGEVWVPGHRSHAWRPYTVGHWVYSDDYGWYWVEDTQEADWGWVTYHYGHWYRDPDFGWSWIPGDEWAPAWVDWRQGDQYVGWAPAPPDQFVVEVDDDPGLWSFVTINNFVAPSIAAVLLPQPQVFFNRTFIVNRTVIVGDRGPRFGVNPGIPPAFVASRIGRPLRTFEVHPRILAGTANLRNAIEVRGEDLRRQRQSGGRPGQRLAQAEVVRPSRTIQPARSVPPPQALARGEPGRVGPMPPTAARGLASRQPSNPPNAQQRLGGTAPATTPPVTAEQRRTPSTTGQLNERRGAERLTPGTPPIAPRTGEAAARRPGNIEQGTVAGGSTQARRPEQRPVPEVRKPLTPATAEHHPVERGPGPAASQHEVKPPLAAAARPTPPKVVARPAPPPAARPSSLPAVAARPAPPPAARPSPPPAVAARPAPPPAARPSPPPAAVARPAPPPAAAPHPAPPPAAAAHAPAPATTGAAPPGRKPPQ
jgi:hypothetical protein